MNMQRRNKLAIAVSLVVAGFLMLPVHGLAAEDEEEGGGDEAVQVEDTPGTDAKTLTFTEEALAHLDVQTEPVRELQVTRLGESAGPRLAIPHSAMTYDAHGHPWVYVKGATDSFLRKSVEIDFMDGDYIYLTRGLEAGEEVVTVGVPEMQGAEFGVGEGE
ncbi:hypothetical protein [Methyloceanibacter sp.]|uniref:hypothetical protein n=1 Tax=Methyloceanibacter sp. TaxID=1965321 RepID=UPI003D6D2B4B